MSSDVFAIYQIDNSEKNREYRCRSYEYQIQHGFMITADNYGTGYSGTASRGMGAEAIRKKMESINPDKFKIRKFGVSDVIGLTAAGKTSFFYVDKDRLVRFNGFFPKPQSGTYLILDEGGYQVAGQKGTWLVSDEVEVDGQRFVQMRSEQMKNPPPSIILHESGAFVTQTALGFDGEATRKMSAFLQGPKPELLHHQKFFENGTAERAKESGTEQTYRDVTLTVERPSFGNGTQAAEAGNSVSPGSLQQLTLPDANLETEDGMIGFSQKVDDRTAYSLLCKKCGATLYYTAVQAESVEKASRLAKLELCAAKDMGAEKLLQQHKRWWKQYWGKSSLQLPDETLEQLWYRANYFLAAGSEPGNAPMPLQGVWCADDDQLPPWKGDYHNDLNTQFTYCHYLTANHPEQGKVFLDYLWSLRPQAAKFARAFYGTAGECLPSVMDIDGGALGGWPMYSLSPTNQIWLCQMFYEYYRLTGDKEFLRTRVEPYFTATAACLEELLQEGPDGKLVLPVSSSPEIHDDEAASWLTPNSNYDLALLHYLFHTLVQIEYQLGNPRGYWHAMEAKLAPLSVDTETGLMLSPNETLQETHRHFSHAMAIEPLCMLRYENPQDRSVIDATVDHLVHLGSGQWVGFSFGWMALLQIARSNGNGALYELHRFAEHFLSRNGFHLNGDYKNSGVCDFHYRPFTLEADFLAAHAVQKMLLRSEKNHIEVLPACPQGWKNEPVAFQNLRAENGLLISYQRTADGKHSLTVKATQDGSWYLCNTHCWVTLQAGQTQSYQWTEENKK